MIESPLASAIDRVKDVSRADQPCDALGRRVPEQVVLRHRGGGASVFVQHDHVGDLIRLGQVVRDEHRNLAPLAQCLAELGRQLAPKRCIERRERLVEQQHIGIGRERARERDALLLTARKLRGVPRAERADAQSIDDPFGAFGCAVTPVHSARDAVGDVPRDGHVREERVSLKHVPDAPLLRRQVDALGAVEQRASCRDDAARVGCDEAGDALQGQCLSRTRRPDEGDDRLVARPGRVEYEISELLSCGDAQHQNRSRAARPSASISVRTMPMLTSDRTLAWSSWFACT